MLTDSLYAKYISERQEGKILEDSFGFVAYRIIGPECFIIEMYISPESRKSGMARSLVSKLESIAKEHGSTHITGNIHLDDKGASNTLISALMIGFKVVSANAGVLLIAKELGGK